MTSSTQHMFGTEQVIRLLQFATAVATSVQSNSTDFAPSIGNLFRLGRANTSAKRYRHPANVGQVDVCPCVNFSALRLRRADLVAQAIFIQKNTLCQLNRRFSIFGLHYFMCAGNHL